MGAEMTLRSRRQLTLPAEVCEALDIHAGDHLEISLIEGGALLKPRKALALQALREIQHAFASQGLGEEDLQREGRKLREQLSRSKYGES